MSSCSIIYVEYKDKIDEKWHLLQSYVPLNNRIWERENPEDNQENTITLNENKFYISSVIEKYGIIRDLLNDPRKQFNNRGFPEDLSKELKEILDKQQDEITKLNKSDERENIINNDWRYGKSWCFLTELENVISESFRISEKNLINEEFSNELYKIDSKLDYICNKLFPDIKKENEQKTNVDDIDSSLLDELDDLIYARGFCYSISELIKFITGNYPFENNIRIIYYTE